MSSYTAVEDAYLQCLTISEDILFPGLNVSGDKIVKKQLLPGRRFFNREEFIALRRKAANFSAAVESYEGEEPIDQMVEEIKGYVDRVNGIFEKIDRGEF